MNLITFDFNYDLANHVANFLQVPLIIPTVTQFADGEMLVAVPGIEALRGQTVALMHATSAPVNDNIMKILLCVRVLKNAGARVVGVVPYFGYSRHDKSELGNPGHLALIADLFVGAGVDELMAVELHALESRALFAVPVHNLTCDDLIIEKIKNTVDGQAFCIVAPDAGAQERAQRIAHKLGVGVIPLRKCRTGDSVVVEQIQKNCTGLIAVVIDDIVDTGGTALQVGERLKGLGFTTLIGIFIHPVFSGDALENLSRSCYTKIFVSNTIPLKISVGSNIEIFDVSEVLALALKKY